MANRQKTDYIIVHCSATQAKSDIGAAEISRWHRERGWDGIGYHFVIRRNGVLEKGRNVDAVGAHAPPFNSVSVGICLVGGIDAHGGAENNFTDEQFSALLELIQSMKVRYPNAEVIGHRDVPNTKKDCPCFDVRQWLETVGG